MKLAVVGTGYVGLVAGTCFAEYGNRVYCVDIDEKKIENLKKGILPIYEPGLEEMVLRNHKNERLLFTTDLKFAVENSDIVFVAVGTPGLPDGRPDISGVLAVARAVGEHANADKVVVNKSTVPVGMADQVQDAASEKAKFTIDVVSNPEFLREGHAIEDFMKPERVVIGADSEAAARMMQELYAPFIRESNNPLYVMSVKSAELTKYACNCFLAMKISFANTMANLCDSMGANYLDIKKGLGSDSRIGNKFLNAGIGYGGSCFPKDVRALISLADERDIEVGILREVENLNNKQKSRIINVMTAHYELTPDSPEWKDKKIAIWGLAFKPGTDDMREAPSITIIKELHRRGAKLFAHDPVAEEESRHHFGDLVTYGDQYDILKDADALLLLTEWSDYREPDFPRMKSLLKDPLIFDGRNIYPISHLQKQGFDCYGIGVRPETARV